MAVTDFGVFQNGGNYICKITDHVNFEKYDLIFNPYCPDLDTAQEFTDWRNNTLPNLSLTMDGVGNYTGWEIADPLTLQMILSLYASGRWGDPGVDEMAQEPANGYPFDRIRKGEHNKDNWRDTEDGDGETPWENEGLDIGPGDFTLEDIPAPYKDGSSNTSIGLKAININNAYLGQWDIGEKDVSPGSSYHNSKYDPLHFKSTVTQGRNLFHANNVSPDGIIRFWTTNYHPPFTRDVEQKHYTVSGYYASSTWTTVTTPAFYEHHYFNDNIEEEYPKLGLANGPYNLHYPKWVVPLIRKTNVQKIYSKSNIEYAANNSAEHTALSDNHNTTKYIAAMVAGNLGFDTTTPQGYDLGNTSWKINDGNYKIPSSVEENLPCRASGSKNVSLAALARKTYHIREACDNLNFGHGINLFINENDFNFNKKKTPAVFNIGFSTNLLEVTPDNLTAAQFNNPSNVSGDTSKFSSAGPFRMSDFRGVGHRGVGYEVSSYIGQKIGDGLPRLTLGTRPSFPGSEALASQTSVYDFPSEEHTQGKMNYGLIVKQTGQLHLGGDPTEVSGSNTIRIDANDNSDHFLETLRDGPTSVKRPRSVATGTMYGQPVFEIQYSSSPLLTVNKTQYLISYKDYINNGKVNRDDYLDHHENNFYITL